MQPLFLDRHTLRELILDFYTTYDPQRLRDGIDINGMVNWTFQHGLPALNEMLYKNYHAEIDPNKRVNSNTRDAFKRVSAALVTPVQITEDESKRQEILSKLKAFYTKYDQTKLNSLQKLVDFAMYRGVDLLNHKLMDKYGENLDSFDKPRAPAPPPVVERRQVAAFSEETGPPPPKAINIGGQSFSAVNHLEPPPRIPSEAAPRMPSLRPPTFGDDDGMTVLPPPPPIEDFVDPDTIEEELKKFYTYHDPGKLDVVDALAAWVLKIGRIEFNNKLDQLYGATLDDEIPDKREEPKQVMVFPTSNKIERPVTPPKAESEVSPMLQNDPQMDNEPKQVIPENPPPPVTPRYDVPPVSQRRITPPPVTPRINPPRNTPPKVAPRQPEQVYEAPPHQVVAPTYEKPAFKPPQFTKPTPLESSQPQKLEPPSPPVVKPIYQKPSQPVYTKPTPLPTAIQTPVFTSPVNRGRQGVPSILADSPSKPVYSKPQPRQVSETGIGLLSSNAFKSNRNVPAEKPSVPQATKKETTYVPQGVTAVRGRFESNGNNSTGFKMPKQSQFGGFRSPAASSYPKPATGHMRANAKPTYPKPAAYSGTPRIPKPNSSSYKPGQPTYAKPKANPSYSKVQAEKPKPPPPTQGRNGTPYQFVKKAQASTASVSRVAKDGACNSYKLDMTGQTFGVCVCGFPRASHKRR